ncbi:MAG: hypothetical protein ACI9A1_001695 [Lentimonas sp.]|jgi:hypothetical protein
MTLISLQDKCGERLFELQLNRFRVFWFPRCVDLG